jgi:hypothetical protein
MDGVDETLKTGKMITRWINKLKKDFPEYDFSVYPDLLNVVSKMENITLSTVAGKRVSIKASDWQALEKKN